MKGELSSSKEESFALLDELLVILECDPLIDELGFIHPSQFSLLNIESDAKADADVLVNKNQVFWSRDHKLGISMQYLLPLYNGAKCKFMSLCAKYKASGDLSSTETDTDIEHVSRSFGFSETETQLLKLSKAVLLLSGDFGTAWNMRKHIISKKSNIAMLMDELLLSALVLSLAPKTEHAWNHRRWAIKVMARNHADLQEIVEKESDLVEKIAETSKMNYRAWNHRSWLVSYMSRQQVLNQLNKSRKWAGLHVADNSCFHYRRRLMHRILNDSKNGEGLVVFSNHDPFLYNLWKEELDWNVTLIRRYIGREALWLHRRYLSVCWAKHFSSDNHSYHSSSDEHNASNHLTTFMDNEIDLLQHCLNIPENGFDDVQAQKTHATAYILWLNKQIFEPAEINMEEKLEPDDLKTLLTKVCPEKTIVWDSLLRAG